MGMDELEKYRLRYVLYIAEMRIDEEKGFPPPFAYGETEQQARVNLQAVFSPADWSRVQITSITPHPEGFDLSAEIHLQGMINELFYREYVSTIQRIELPPKGVTAFARPLTTTLDIFADILQMSMHIFPEASRRTGISSLPVALVCLGIIRRPPVPQCL